MEMGQLVTTFVLLDTLHDDSEEGQSKIEKLLVPLALCGCMGSGQSQQVATTTSPAGGTATQPTYVTDNSSQFMQVLLLSAFMRRRPHSRTYSSE